MESHKIFNEQTKISFLNAEDHRNEVGVYTQNAHARRRHYAIPTDVIQNVREVIFPILSPRFSVHIALFATNHQQKLTIRSYTNCSNCCPLRCFQLLQIRNIMQLKIIKAARLPRHPVSAQCGTPPFKQVTELSQGPVSQKH